MADSASGKQMNPNGHCLTNMRTGSPPEAENRPLASYPPVPIPLQRFDLNDSTKGQLPLFQGTTISSSRGLLCQRHQTQYRTNNDLDEIHKIGQLPNTVIVMDDGPSNRAPVRSAIYNPPPLNGNLEKLQSTIGNIPNRNIRALIRQLVHAQLNARDLEIAKLRSSHWNLQLELRVLTDNPSPRARVRSAIYQEPNDFSTRLQAAIQFVTRDSELIDLRKSHWNLQLENESLRKEAPGPERTKYSPRRHVYLILPFSNPTVERYDRIRLFHLPAEVRDMIYDAVIEAAVGYGRRLHDILKYSGLSSTCKQINAEFLSRAVPLSQIQLSLSFPNAYLNKAHRSDKFHPIASTILAHRQNWLHTHQNLALRSKRVL